MAIVSAAIAGYRDEMNHFSMPRPSTWGREETAQAQIPVVQPAVFAAHRGAEDGLRLARVHAAQDAPGGVAMIINGLCKRSRIPFKGRSGTF